jgi:1-deoxy-D-xylulose-5-phosphate synthase
VLFCIDRAGVVGSDGPTHHGIYDIPMLRCLPNLIMMQPANNRELDAMIRFALTHDGPATIRYPREPGPQEGMRECANARMCECENTQIKLGEAQVLHDAPAATIWLWALGDMIPLATDVAEKLASKGITAGVVNARFIKPLDLTLLKHQAAQGTKLFITFENGAAAGGFGSAITEALAAEGISTPVKIIGWPDRFMGQGSTAQLCESAGLTVEQIVQQVAR